ncbi:MAG: HD domain-containing protein [Candidatus Tectomicrobia bacterium]|uniref:HD domain-containing protein n=1 Tax=Tectimicrobiota bacterium TaxID=2528274 RepID=A0A933GL77_UNCTE|nr:HD domain-containing protein [Candidatus Tectomicrobia bacterium]
MDEMESIMRCIEMGAADYLPKPFNPLLLQARINASLATKWLHDQEEISRQRIEEYNRVLEGRVQEQLQQLQESFAKLRKTLDGTVLALSSALERRDPYTAGHQQRVAQLACAIAKEIGLPEDRIEGLRVAGILHDIGKISVPFDILSKPGRIIKEEFNIIKIHSQVGYDILKSIEFPWEVAKFVLQHHESFDGSGYPAGLARENISLEARILKVADVVEAMASHRPYRASLGISKALEEILEKRGLHFDPAIVDACIIVFQEKGFAFD